MSSDRLFDVSFIFFILFPRLRPHMAVTGVK
nr:MAG TPA: hypothetical protein [Caudoviricetes sp.]DAK38711.1 MAG TPA: hypothetical protein [Caudoviricetes sp.]